MNEQQSPPEHGWTLAKHAESTNMPAPLINANQEMRMAGQSSITKWNLLALLAAFAGGGATLGLDQIWLNNWVNSGNTFAIGQRVSTHLPAGTTRVYYESAVAVPVGDASLRVIDADGERMPVRLLDGDENYRLLFSGWSGRALWEVNVPAAATYEIVCHNHNFMSDADIPAEDRVVFLKQPDSFKEVKTFRTIIQVTGATITMTAVIILYLLHSLTLQRRRRQSTRAA